MAEAFFKLFQKVSFAHCHKILLGKDLFFYGEIHNLSQKMQGELVFVKLQQMACHAEFPAVEGGSFFVAEAKLVNSVFVFQNAETAVYLLYFGECPAAFKRHPGRKHVFKTVCA